MLKKYKSTLKEYKIDKRINEVLGSDRKKCNDFKTLMNYGLRVEQKN